MDYEKYYDMKADGSYVIHFPNSKGLSKATLQEMFSEFGEVLSVDDRGQSFGLCFVRYKKLEDVKHCLDGFKNHNIIKILPHKNKAKLTNSKSKSHSQDKDYRQNKDNRKNGSPNATNIQKMETELNKQQFNHQTNSNMSRLTKNRNTSMNNTIDTEDASDTSLSSSVRTTNGGSHSNKGIQSVPPLMKYTRLPISTLNASVSSDAFNENSKKLVQLYDTDEIPALISTNQPYKTGAVSSLKVLLAQEIIVSNIHHSLSIHYILHLFEKYNPIAISLMMTIQHLGIRYCHVYYETVEDALATVEEFDNCLLRGKNLMVLTLQKLLEDAASF